jgi:predicted RNA binding protein YcfA (HicA-like mRNA interferase family)
MYVVYSATPLSAQEMRKRFEKAGWYLDRQSGSHMIMKIKTETGETTFPIPDHKELGMERKCFKKLKEMKS